MTRAQTIAAIATAPGRGGVAVIRVSGPEAFAVAERLVGTVPEAGRFRYATFRDATGRTIDAGLVLSFRAPHSYTGEDVVEFHSHGGVVTPRRVLEACLAAGAHPARRGEFTERAFLNGRLSYDQAEAVLDLIDAKTARAADAALEGLGGEKGRTLRALYDDLVELSSTVEHALDIDEGDLPADFGQRLEGRLAEIRRDLAQALTHARTAKILNTGARVVLAGPPNAGKSSLLNALVGENRAIVSDIPGTTRDAIETWLDLDGWPVRLVDTAGLRCSEDRIEAEGVRRAEDLMAEADVVLHLTPCGAGPGEVLPRLTDRTTVIEVVSKIDLAAAAPGAKAPLAVSVKTGEGLDALRRAIVSALETKASACADEGELADRFLSTLIETENALPAEVNDLVLAGTALARAAELLGRQIGATYSDDLLDALFSRFCVGK